jgi:hypothetical protein
MKPQVRAMGLALAVVALLSGTVAAGHLAENVTSYTGCLVSKDGVIIKIKAGEAPSSPCSGGMVQVHFSGGDITSIAVTGALTGGGTNGAVTIGLKPEFTLPTGCDSGEIAEWNGTAWACGVDSNTTYTAGTGLDVTGTTFSIEPDFRVKNTPDCPSGQFATGFADTGTITCAAPPAPPAASIPYVSTSSPDAGIPDDDVFRPYGTLAPGSGTYLILAKGTIFSEQNATQFRGVDCRIRVDGTIVDSLRITSDTLNAVEQIPFALMWTASVTTNFALECRANDGADGVQLLGAKLVGVKL